MYSLFHSFTYSLYAKPETACFISHFDFHEIQKNKIDDEYFYNVAVQLLPINQDVLW